MTRRLAAIMITDVVGYSRLSHADEEGTRRRFQADHHNRNTIKLQDVYTIRYSGALSWMR